MTDPVFQAPPVQAPDFNQQPTPPVAPQTSQPVSPAPVSETSVAQPQTPVATNEPVPQPLPPQNNGQSVDAQNSAQAKVDELRQKLSKVDLTEVKEKIQKRLWAVLGGCFLIGMMFGCTMSGGKEQPQQSHGLELRAITVPNSDIGSKNKLYRCGKANQLSDPCVYYIMNFEHYDKMASDFFSEVADKTGRPLFKIQTENPTYGQQLIKPGYFAQIIVPSLD